MDYIVDRPEVEVRQRMQLTGTNQPEGLTYKIMQACLVAELVNYIVRF